jgi:hypothetical protein
MLVGLASWQTVEEGPDIGSGDGVDRVSPIADAVNDRLGAGAIALATSESRGGRLMASVLLDQEVTRRLAARGWRTSR